MKDIANPSAALDALNVSKVFMAKEIGISRSYLYDVLSGKREPTRPVIERLLAFLNRPENLKKLRRRRPVTFEELFTPEARASKRSAA